MSFPLLQIKTSWESVSISPYESHTVLWHKQRGLSNHNLHSDEHEKDREGNQLYIYKNGTHFKNSGCPKLASSCHIHHPSLCFRVFILWHVRFIWDSQISNSHLIWKYMYLLYFLWSTHILCYDNTLNTAISCAIVCAKRSAECGGRVGNSMFIYAQHEHKYFSNGLRDIFIGCARAALSFTQRQ
jgi:hypothetical protein